LSFIVAKKKATVIILLLTKKIIYSIIIIVLIIVLREIILQGKRKHSRKRDSILQAIRSSYAHPGAQDIYEKLKPQIPDLSLGTVYRNLNMFIKDGLVSFVGTINGEERFDGIVTPHPHVCCTNCGKIADLNDEQTSKFSNRIQMQIPGFTIDIRNVTLYGLCDKCKETAALGR